MPLSILDYKSIRFKKIHFNPMTLERREFSSINKAKAESRKLGGAGYVVAAKSEKEFGDYAKFCMMAFNTRRLEEERRAAEEAAAKAKEEAK